VFLRKAAADCATDSAIGQYNAFGRFAARRGTRIGEVRLIAPPSHTRGDQKQQSDKTPPRLLADQDQSEQTETAQYSNRTISLAKYFEP